jgi:1L-myo-inositol 1-phosphate cytidylyltransferase
MQKITDAVILMAGSGSRLGGLDGQLPKPLLPINGRPLISYAINSFAQIGLKTLHIIVGAKGEMLVRETEILIPRHMELHPIHNPQWEKQNGISLLRAAGQVHGPFFLAMGDHLFEPSLLEQLLAGSNREELNMAIDRKIDSIFDLNDAMKVGAQNGRVRSIGKKLRTYDAIDTGLFISPQEFFEYLERAKKDDDCSLADGVRLMAAAGKVNAIDIGDAWWQDVDTPEMRARAEEGVRALWPEMSGLRSRGRASCQTHCGQAAQRD